MKKLSSVWLFVLPVAMTLSSCELLGGVFKAGFYTAIIFIVLIVLLIIWFVRRRR